MQTNQLEHAKEDLKRVLSFNVAKFNFPAEQERIKFENLLMDTKAECRRVMHEIDELQNQIMTLLTMTGSVSEGNYDSIKELSKTILGRIGFSSVAHGAVVKAHISMKNYDEGKTYIENSILPSFPVSLGNISSFLGADVDNIIHALICLGPALSLQYINILKNYSLNRSKSLRIREKLKELLDALMLSINQKGLNAFEWSWVASEQWQIDSFVKVFATITQQMSSKDYSAAIISLENALQVQSMLAFSFHYIVKL
jgi:hypothetical protein